MKKVIIIVIIASTIAVISWGTLKVSKKIVNISKQIELEKHRYDPEKMFTDQKVIELCYAAKEGNIKKMNELFEGGVDINTEGQAGITPFLWLVKFSELGDEEIMKKSFKYFVDNNADPLKIYNGYSNVEYIVEESDTVLHFIAANLSEEYLKILLEANFLKSVDVELSGATLPTPILRAYFANRFNNFVILLNYGANVNYKAHGVIENVLLDIVSVNYSWNYTYELLKKEVNYMSSTRYGKPSVIWAIENYSYTPSFAIESQNTDYRQKCVEYLEDHGVPKIHPDMPADEKYEKENGKYQLYILEKEGEKKEQWVKFEDSSRYKPEKDNGVYQEELK
jgi:ankyrin repeat protein